MKTPDIIIGIHCEKTNYLSDLPLILDEISKSDQIIVIRCSGCNTQFPAIIHNSSSFNHKWDQLITLQNHDHNLLFEPNKYCYHQNCKGHTCVRYPKDTIIDEIGENQKISFETNTSDDTKILKISDRNIRFNKCEGDELIIHVPKFMQMVDQKLSSNLGIYENNSIFFYNLHHKIRSSMLDEIILNKAITGLPFNNLVIEDLNSNIFVWISGEQNRIELDNELQFGDIQWLYVSDISDPDLNFGRLHTFLDEIRDGTIENIDSIALHFIIIE
ncbi:MAG: hypothetical protein INQ03_14340 [Candidatus Heimdallarchaeota archaeon]|nr:hypothetical protein [Candidatus Heimdallarchaeota archaeon]